MLVFIFALIVITAFLLRFCIHLWTLSGHMQERSSFEISAHQYRAVLRLSTDEDLDFAWLNTAAQREARAQRRQVFRNYLRRLSLDYGRLLAGMRRVMVQSGVDRPDLAKALLRNRVLFAIALCRIDVRLGLHVLGIDGLDASKLVEAFDVLHNKAGVFVRA